MSSQDLLKFLNAYLSNASPIIKAHGGFIDKFIGDAIMAIFPNSPQDAIDASVNLCKALNSYNLDREKKVREPFRIGIGIHTGKMALGTVGSEERMDTTVIGDNVNLASRLESLTKVFHIPILISESLYEMLDEKGRREIREIDIVTVKGKTKPIKVFEVLSVDRSEVIEKKKAVMEILRSAIQLYREEKFIEAKTLFIKCQQLCPEDSIPVVYINRCETAINETKLHLNSKQNSDQNTILIVDDNIAILDLMKFALKKNKFNVITSNNGKEAVLKYGEFNPNYILMDLFMPDIDGFMVADIIKDFANMRDENPLIIFVTSDGDDQTKEKIKNLGYEFLEKPLQIPDLLEKIKIHQNQRKV